MKVLAAWLKEKLNSSRPFRFLLYCILLGLLLVPYFILSSTPFSMAVLQEFFLGLPVILIIFLLIINLLPYLRARDFDDAAHHLLVLVITLLSFYAFGWPRIMDELPEKFSKLCVVLVLFVLSELAVQLTLRARDVKREIQKAGDDLVSQLRALSANLERVVSPVRQAQENLQALVPEIRSAAVSVAEQVQLVAEINKCQDTSFADVLLTQLRVYASAWAELIREVKLNKDDDFAEERVRAWGDLLRTYIEEEEKDISGKEVEIGSSGQYKEYKMKLPTLATNDAMYLRLLKVLSETVYSHHRSSSDRHVLLRAITNAMPSQWYNWPRGASRRCHYEPIADYREQAADICRMERVDFRRMILVFDDEKFPDASSDKRERIFEQTGVPFARSLYHDCRDYYHLRITTDPEGKNEVGDGGVYTIKRLEAILGFNAFADKCLPHDKVYPILSADHGFLKGIPEDDYTEQRGYYMRKTEIWKKYLEDLHHNEGDALVGLLHDISEINLLPDRAPDMLLVGFRDADVENWLMAIASTLRLGSPTMLMSISSDPDTLRRHYVSFWNRFTTHEERFRTLRSFIEEIEEQYDSAI